MYRTGSNRLVIDQSGLNYKRYGLRECLLCEDKLVAKTGKFLAIMPGMKIFGTIYRFYHVIFSRRIALKALNLRLSMCLTTGSAIRTSFLQLVDLESIPLSSYAKDFKKQYVQISKLAISNMNNEEDKI